MSQNGEIILRNVGLSYGKEISPEMILSNVVLPLPDLPRIMFTPCGKTALKFS